MLALLCTSRLVDLSASCQVSDDGVDYETVYDIQA